MQTNGSMQRKSTEIRDWPMVAWWIRITSPAPGSPRYGHNPRWREEVTSLLFPIVLLLVLIPIPTAFGNPLNLTILLVVLCIDVGALLLKRAGMMHIAGAIILTTVELGLCTAILGTGRINITSLILFNELLQSAIITIAFFPPTTVFFICVLNCSFIFGVLKFLPHEAVLDSQLTQNLSSTILSPVQLQVFVAAVSFIIIRALVKEIKRADNAEELAQLRQSEAELQKREAEQAQQLEEGIQLILQALNTAAAKGDFSMRVPLAQENILWRVGYSINNLLARLQGFRQEKAELEKTRAVANQLTECIRQRRQYPLSQWTGTCLDQFIIELNKQPKLSAGPSDQSSSHKTSHHYQ